jgi:hypothetical protein
MAGECDLSCNVLVIPEDPTLNGYILHPLVSRLLESCGKGNAKVTVLRNPKVSGFEHACGSMPAIVERYKYFDLLLFLPDADGKDRSGQFALLESEHGRKLICCAAAQEVEAWLLAGHLDRLAQPWPEIRADISVKENIFAPFLNKFGDSRQPGGGRETLMRQTLTNLRGLLERCPELATLQTRICEALA